MIDDIKKSRTVRSAASKIVIGIAGMLTMLSGSFPLLVNSLEPKTYGYIAFVFAILTGIHEWYLRRDTKGKIGG